MKAQTQKEKILQLLQENPAGINSFGVAREIALQLPTRILELKRKDYDITSIHKEDGSVDYILNILNMAGTSNPSKARFEIKNGRYIAII